jgi:S-formylglutathione hydrolase FrmB
MRTSKLLCARSVICLALLAAASPAVWAQGRIECSTVSSKILKASVRYCAFLPPSYDAAAPARGAPAASARRYPVVYYLHGLGDSERSLLDSGGWNLVQDLREQNRIGDFLIVTPEGDRTFYINSHDGRVRYSDFFLQEFVPAMEHRYRIRAGRSWRGIMGISMGGYGALRIAFANPQSFASVSAHSAALMPESPENLNVAVQSGFRGASLLGDVFGNPIDVAFWRQNSPLVLARKNAAAVARLKIYFDCGAEDDYGFDRGAKALHEQLVEENIRHEFHLYPGNHSLVYFLQHIGASFEFHWRGFAGAEGPRPR